MKEKKRSFCLLVYGVSSERDLTNKKGGGGGTKNVGGHLGLNSTENIVSKSHNLSSLVTITLPLLSEFTSLTFSFPHLCTVSTRLCTENSGLFFIGLLLSIPFASL